MFCILIKKKALCQEIVIYKPWSVFACIWSKNVLGRGLWGLCNKSVSYKKKKKPPQTNKQTEKTNPENLCFSTGCVLDKNFEPKLLPVFLIAENPYQGKKKKGWYHVTVDRMGSLDSLTDPKADRAWAYSCACVLMKTPALVQLRLTAFTENGSCERRPQHSRSSQCSPLPPRQYILADVSRCLQLACTVTSASETRSILHGQLRKPDQWMPLGRVASWTCYITSWPGDYKVKPNQR